MSCVVPLLHSLYASHVQHAYSLQLLQTNDTMIRPCIPEAYICMKLDRSIESVPS